MVITLTSSACRCSSNENRNSACKQSSMDSCVDDSHNTRRERVQWWIKERYTK